MKTNILALSLLSLAILITGCDKDNDPVINEVGNNKFLTILPSIENRAETKSGAVKSFNLEDRIGLFVEGSKIYNNIPAEYDGTKWMLNEIEGAKTIQAYFPYSAEYETIDAVNVDINEQTDFMYSGNTTVNSNNVAALRMKHALSLVSIIVMKNDYIYQGKISEIKIDGIPTTGEVNLHTGEAKVTGKPVVYKKAINYTLDDYNPEKVSTIVFSAVLEELGEVTFAVMVDDVYWSFNVHPSHVWEVRKEYTYTLNLYESYNPDVSLEEIPVDVSYWNTYGKSDKGKITILDKPNQGLWFHFVGSDGGKMTIKGEGQVFGGRITNNASTDWEGQWRFALYDLSGNLVELYQPYDITIPAKSYDGGEIPCFIDCEPGKYRAVPLLKDKGTNYWYEPRQQFEGLDYYTVLPKSANVTPSLRSTRVEGAKEAYTATSFFQLNDPFFIVLTITNKAGVPLKGEIKAVQERILTTDFIPYTLDYLQASGYNTDQYSDEIGRISIDYSSDVKIKQEQMFCSFTNYRPKVNMCGPAIRFYYKAEGTGEWTLMRTDYDHQFEVMKGITELINYRNDGWNLDENCLVAVRLNNPATNIACARAKE